MGRESANDIVVEHPVVSRKHARIFYDAGGYWIQDLDSQNGTFIDKRRLGPQAHSLKSGERIQLGSATTGTVWEFSEVQGADPSLEAPPTVQNSVGPAASTQAGAVPEQPGLSGWTQTQKGKSSCAAFMKNLNGTWTADPLFHSTPRDAR